MSPDPPREDSGDDDNNRLGRFNGDVIEGILDDQDFFLVPDAPYELDMEDESDYTDTDDEEGGTSSQNQNAVRPHAQNPVEGIVVSGSEEPVIVEGQGRGRYRLLIPFPSATPDTDVSSNDTGTEVQRGGSGEDQSSVTVISETHNSNRSSNSNRTRSTEDSSPSSADIPNQPSTSKSKSQEPKREIEMTEEKVETIMQVMKNITLPAAAIPNWAAELDEDVWKRKLHDSISTKSAKNEKESSKTVISKDEER